MKNENLNSQMKKVGVGLLAGVLVPGAAWACACGCGVFDVGTGLMLPEGAGGMAFLDYDYQDQNQNWSGNSSAPAANNGDKEIETHFVTLGLQYMFNRSWGAQIEVPYWTRTFNTDVNFGAPPAQVVSRNWSGLGDLRIKGIYTGFSEDLSSGITFGLKLPTGSDNRDGDVVDRDTQISSGSTDVLLGGFYRHQLTHDNSFTWFTQAELDVPVLKQGDYRPGLEADAAAGIYYNNLSLGRVKITPVAQVIGSWRGRDNGAAAAPDDSGYQRVLLSPGIEFHLHPVKIYADVEIPVYQNMNGNQLVAPALVKVSLSYMF
jgi:hypothetical protein